jgi:hypothetical protein
MTRLPLQPTSQQRQDCEAAWELALLTSMIGTALGPDRIAEDDEKRDPATRDPAWRRLSSALSTTVFLPSTICTHRFFSVWRTGCLKGHRLPPIIAVLHLAAFVVFCPACGGRWRARCVRDVACIFERCFFHCYKSRQPHEADDGPLTSTGDPFPSLFL